MTQIRSDDRRAALASTSTSSWRRFELPPLPEGEHGARRCSAGPTTSRSAHVDVALAHPIKLIVNALGPPPKDVIDQAHAHGVKVAALAGKAVHAQRHVEQRRRRHRGAGLRGRRAHRRDLDDGARARGRRRGRSRAGARRGRHRQRPPDRRGAGARRARACGLGSLWLTTAESDSSPAVLEAYLDATSADTVRSRCYTGKPARQVAQRLDRGVGARQRPGPLGMPLQNILTSEANARIARSGRTDLAFAPVGQIVGRMNEVRSVRDVIFELVEEYIETVERLEKGVEV